MPDPRLVRVNNMPYSWTSSSFFFNGLPYKGVTEFKYKETREVKLVHAAQQDGTPVGTTSGIYKVESASVTLLRDSAYGLMADLSILGLGSYGDAEFTIIMNLFEFVPPVALPPQIPSIPQQVIVNACRVTGIEETQAVGSDELVTIFTLQPKFIIRPVGTLFSLARALLP